MIYFTERTFANYIVMSNISEDYFTLRNPIFGLQIL